LGAADPAATRVQPCGESYRWTWAFLLAASLLVFPGYVIYFPGSWGRLWREGATLVSRSADRFFLFCYPGFFCCVCIPCLGKWPARG